MQKHAFLTLLGLLLAALAVAWIRPNATGGTAFVVVISVLFVNAIGIAIWPRNKKQKDKPPASNAAAVAPRPRKRKAVEK
jgi:hypothetical protein